MKRRTKKRANQGMTLVEILAVSMLLVVVVIGFLGLMLVNFALNEHSRNVVIALNDAASVLETMRSFPFSVAGIQSQFVNDAVVSGYNNLTAETVVVKYSSIGSESVTANVIVRWSERNRNYQETLTTIITKR